MPTLFGIFFGMPGHLELLILAFVVLLLFGHRLPSVMRSLGRGVVEFKEGLHGEPEPDESSDGDSKDKDKDKAKVEVEEKS